MTWPDLPMRMQRAFGRTLTQRSSNTPLSALLERLSGQMGSESATLELKWMREEVRTRRSVASVSAITSPSRKRDDMEWEVGELAKMVNRRLKGEPLQYILGNQPFGPIAIKTRAPTLIPRPETEDWTIRLAALLEDRFPIRGRGGRKVLRVLDLCTGTGCIPILLSHLRRQAGGITAAYGVDISTNAVCLARENATDQSLTPSSGLDSIASHDGDPEAGTEVEETGEFCGGTNRGHETINLIATNAAGGGQRSSFDVIRANIFQENFVQEELSRMELPFDVITSNPPYIPLDEYERLPRPVREWEDRRALLGDLPRHQSGGDSSDGRGLTFYHRIAEIVSTDGVLGANGVVALEVGYRQAEEVRGILKGKVSATEVWKDPWGVPRVVVGHR